jgi:hypothetical protein
MLTLLTPPPGRRIASWIMPAGTPEPPCSTRCTGVRSRIARRRVEVDPGLAGGVVAVRRPDRDRERIDPVSATKRPASSGSVKCSSSSSVSTKSVVPILPSSASTETPRACARRAHLGAHRDVLLERLGGLVDHHRGEAGVDRLLNDRISKVWSRWSTIGTWASRPPWRRRRPREEARIRAVALELALRDLDDHGRARALAGAQDRADHAGVARARNEPSA